MIELTFVDEVSDGEVRLIPFVIDAVPEERIRRSAIATEDEIEEGASTTDHVRPERPSITFEAVVSDTPIASNDAVTVTPAVREIPIEGPNGDGAILNATILEPDGTVTRVDDALAVLEDAFDRSLLAVVVSRYLTLESAALLELVATRTAADGTWLRASLTFREVGFQRLQIVEDPVPLRPRDRREEDAGAQEAQPANERTVSLLSRIFG